MKRRQYILEPETVAEKDGIIALRLAMNDYIPGYSGAIFAFGGDILREAGADQISHVRSALESAEIDDYGRDANGIDIAAALKTLDSIEAV
jgi:hypothetical protein